MNHLVKKGLTELSKLGREAIKTASRSAARASAAPAAEAARGAITHTAASATQTARAVSQTRTGQKAAAVARTAAAAGPVKEVAAICGRAGVAGAVVDGALGGVQAASFLRQGKIDGVQAIKHVGAEAGCGFVTSSSGTAGTIVIYMVTGSMGPAALAAGMGASLGSRYVYRKIVGETLPKQEGRSDEERPRQDDDNPLEDIGPKPQS